MFVRQPQEGSRPLSIFPLIVTSFVLLPLILISSPNSLLASAAPLDTPKLLSLLVPWAEKPAGPGVGALEALGEAPYLSSPEDERRLQAFLDSDHADSLATGPAEWESPKNPDLFLLTEVGGGAEEEGERRRRRGVTQDTEMDDEMAEVAHRMKRNGGFSVGGSRIRTSIGGGVMGAGGARGGFGSFGNGRGGGGAPIGGRMNEGPSLSIVNPLDVLRQRLLLEIARRRMRESEDQILANREILKSIGKREVPGTEESNAGETEEKANEHKTPIQNPASM